MADIHLARLEAHPKIGLILQRSSCESLRESSAKVTVVCGHVGANDDAATWLRPSDNFAPGCFWLVSTNASARYRRTLESDCGSSFAWNDVRHTFMGGLTKARLRLGWRGPTLFPTSLSPGKRRVPLRPLGRFLEPSVRLGAYRPTGSTNMPCWRPLSDQPEPFPWPWPDPLPWVEAQSCFIRESTLERPLTDKERCQLIDLREDWRDDLLDDVWCWNAGAPPPLRLLSEFALGVLPWLHGGQDGEVLKDASEMNVVDGGRVRPPWVGSGGDGSVNDFLGWNWAVDAVGEVVIATKADDAKANLSLWAIGGDDDGMEEAREVIRSFLFKLWFRRLEREATKWLLENREGVSAADRIADEEGVRDCLERCRNSDWWNWTDGSRLFFWRWPECWRREARDGAKGFHTGTPPPRAYFPPIAQQEPWVIAKDMEKLEILLCKRYLVPGKYRTAVPRFAVPKGTDDIRVVWDLAKNGLNEHMYTPNFFLPTMGTYLRRVHNDSHSGDFDIGEQFHNYRLHKSEQIYCGVNIPDALRAKLKAEGLDIGDSLRWDRLVFGWQSSPYLALRMLARAVEISMGNPSADGNAFGWESVELNLPGMDTYDPGRPRVSKRRADGTVATELIIYFDDGRVVGPTEAAAHAGLRQLTSRLQYLGNQDAARKRRPVSQRPGAWAGGIVYTDQGITRKLLTQAKWDRAKEFLEWIRENLEKPSSIDRKRFRSGKGFLLHVSQTYDFVVPYMKGFHLSEDQWRPGRGRDGWKEKKLVDLDGSALLDEDEDFYDDQIDAMGLTDVNAATSDDAPHWVVPVPRLKDDVNTLLKFFEPASPVHIIVRPVMGACFVAYGAGDASGEGYGSSFRPLGMAPLLRQGFWCTEASEESSNWRELRNLLDCVKVESEAGRLAGKELWLATDNSTAAQAYFKGSSSSRRLHDMVTELRLMTLRGNFVLNIFHISGTRMIDIGIDALSRGEVHVGALGNTLMSAAPLHHDAVQRSPGLTEWVAEWAGPSATLASPQDWFYAAQQAGEVNTPFPITRTWIWSPPPAAALHVLEEIGNARLKRHEVIRGIVLLPQLLSHEWRRRFTKVVDVYFDLDAGYSAVWPKEMHEPLTIGLYLPYLRCAPWDWKRVPFMGPLGRTLRKLYAAGDPDAGDLLRKFWETCIRASTLRPELVSPVLCEPSWRRFLGLPAAR